MSSLSQQTASLLRAMPRLTLSAIKDTPNAKRYKHRPRGRTNGNYCGFGNNGQNTRGTTSRPYLGFEGGQTPFYRVVPRHGKINQEGRLQCHTVSIERILLWIDQGRIDPKKKITMKVLRESGCVAKTFKRDGVYLLGTGKANLTVPLDIEISRATAPAIEAVENVGGKLMCTYYDPVTLRYHLWEEKEAAKGRKVPIRPLPVNKKQVRYYSDPAHNGYLSEKGDGHLVHSAEQFQRWQPRHVVRSKIWQWNPEWSTKREQWASEGLIPTAEEVYEYEEPDHWSNFQGPISRYFGPNAELLPGKDDLVPGQLHVGNKSAPPEVVAKRKAERQKRVSGFKRTNPNTPGVTKPFPIE